jgi:hypothetical protein
MSFRADTVDDVRAALEEHKRTHAQPPRPTLMSRTALPLRAPPQRQALGSRPSRPSQPAMAAMAPPAHDPGVLVRQPASSARVDLAAEIQVEWKSLEDVARSGYTLAPDSIFLPTDPPRSIGTPVHLVLVVADRLFALEGVVVAAYPDPADPRPTRRRGNGVFVTTGCPGWVNLCTELHSDFHDLTEPDRSPLRESVRGGFQDPDFDEFDEEEN